MRFGLGAVLLLAVASAGAAAQEAAAAQGGAAAQASESARLYHDFCSVCHGDAGDGKSRAAGSLVPPPRDFTTPQAGAELTRTRMVKSISEGRPGTAMAGWATQLSTAQIEGLADYIGERFMMAAITDAQAEGRRLFAEYCSVCHGDSGDGRSRAAGSLNPAPRDFTSERSRQELTRNRMIFSVSFGRANTAMAAWEKQLSRTQVEQVVDYIRARFMGIAPGSDVVQGGMGHDHTVPIDQVAELMKASFDGELVGDPVRGKQLFSDNCATCHGENGDGKGPRSYFILPKPRDLRHPAARNSLNRPHLFESIALGRQGTEMPAWRWVLEPQEVVDVAEYVFQTFIVGDAPVVPAAATAAGS